MLYQIKFYIIFWIKSSNQHGVHSPFVYNLITKCFYDKKKYYAYKILKAESVSNKKTRLIFRLSNYFQFKNSLIINNSAIKKVFQIGNKNNKISIIENLSNPSELKKIIENVESKNLDFIYFNINKNKQILLHSFEALLETKTNDSVFIINSIYKNKNITAAWNIIKNHPKVTVTIDTYSLGFVFFRKEQAKEHFSVRL